MSETLEFVAVSSSRKRSGSSTIPLPDRLRATSEAVLIVSVTADAGSEARRRVRQPKKQGSTGRRAMWLLT
jgi:hypothetical protein